MQYRCAYTPGSIFFAVVTEERLPILASAEAVDVLRNVFRAVWHSRPFEIDAIVVMPDHLHLHLDLAAGRCGFPDTLAAGEDMADQALPGSAPVCARCSAVQEEWAGDLAASLLGASDPR